MANSSFLKTLRENTAAIITAIVVFLLAGLYVIVIIPNHEEQIDMRNRSSMQEFRQQFSGTIRDYASTMDADSLKKLIIACARKLDDKKADMYGKTLLADLLSPASVILSDVNNNIITEEVALNGIKETNRVIRIAKTVRYHFRKSINDQFQPRQSTLYTALTNIADTTEVEKLALTQRLAGAISFPEWIIYTNDKNVFLNNGIDPHELDSLKVKSPGGDVAESATRRFYRKTVTVEGTGFSVTLIGAIDLKSFRSEARQIDIHLTFIFILLVILLFLSIPLLKPLISGKKERLTQLDLLNTTIGVGILTIALISFFFTDYLADCNKKRLRTNLMIDSRQATNSFNQEFGKYTYRLAQVDSTLQAKESTNIHTNLDKFSGLNNDPLVSRNIQNFFTFDSSGDIIKDISKGDAFTSRKNFSERDYFKILKKGGHQNILTAVYSRYDNKYKLAYIKANPDSSLSGFAYVPAFNTGKNNRSFLLCDKTGKVIFHSDVTKNLNQNIYQNNQQPYPLTLVFHGLMSDCFEMNYNGSPCLVYAQQLTRPDVQIKKDTIANTNTVVMDTIVKKVTVSDYPVFLLTFTGLQFSNNLKIYTFIDGFVFSLAYVLGITLLILLYSVYFYFGDIPVVSRFHVYWLFPDNSRSREYGILKTLNYSFFVIFSALFLINCSNILFYSILTGINLAFFNFVLLNQRVFRIRKIGEKQDRRFNLLMLTILIFGYLVPLIFLANRLPSYGLSSSLFGHFAYLYFLKKETGKDLPNGTLRSEKSTRKGYISFFSSVLCYHYLLLPAIVIFSLFCNEINTAKHYNASNQSSLPGGAILDPREGHTANAYNAPVQYIKPNQNLFDAMRGVVTPPSEPLLAPYEFEKFTGDEWPLTFSSYFFDNRNLQRTLVLMLSLALLILLVRILINFYAGRFFFFELCEAFRLGYFKTINPFANFKVILPPFNEQDLEDLEKHEKFEDDIKKEEVEEIWLREQQYSRSVWKKKPLKMAIDAQLRPDRVLLGYTTFINKARAKGGTIPKFKPAVWLKGISNKVVPNEVKLDLIMMNNLRRYYSAYKQAWNTLDAEEKFVMNDFAIDHFVNYKNRDVLMKLMEKGYIIADPLTGRLRVMNYGFRNFVSHVDMTAAENEEENPKEKETRTFAKWKIPIFIIAATGLVLLMILNNEEYNKIIFYGGSAASAVGLIAKFMDTYKKSI
ncbi:MAG: hypothetical protein JWO09_2567 [Bacteroidetes bacterium]|nr:hypothetical protein [Bacteroidota bacterium]